MRELNLYADGVQVANGCRMRLRGRSTMTLRPDIWELTVYSMADSALARVERAKEVEVEGTDMSALCRGQVEEIYTHSENGKSQTTIMISDGMDFWLSTVSFALAAGNKITDTIRTLVANCSSPVPIATMQMQDATLLRGQTFHGKTAGYVATLAKSVKARAFLTRGSLAVMTRGITNNTIVLSEEDIANGISQANGACVVQMAEMRGYQIGQLVSLPDDAIKYRLLCQSVDADSYQGIWKTELIMVDESKISIGDDWGGG